MDGRYASDYYSTASAGNYIVYPSSGIRIDNGQTWGTYEVYNNRILDTENVYCSNGTLRNDTSCVGGGVDFPRYNYRGTYKVWTSRFAQIGDDGFGCVVYRIKIYPSCYKNITGWH